MKIYNILLAVGASLTLAAQHEVNPTNEEIDRRAATLCARFEKQKMPDCKKALHDCVKVIKEGKSPSQVKQGEDTFFGHVWTCAWSESINMEGDAQTPKNSMAYFDDNWRFECSQKDMDKTLACYTFRDDERKGGKPVREFDKYCLSLGGQPDLECELTPPPSDAVKPPSDAAKPPGDAVQLPSECQITVLNATKACHGAEDEATCKAEALDKYNKCMKLWEECKPEAKKAHDSCMEIRGNSKTACLKKGEEAAKSCVEGKSTGSSASF
ncbi:1-aminocyclopropane-1-carboxylate oxidase [Purpureocillium lavendulum]|uniref:1-aminocyclopropane-1-carboxylate oxidase n=1 Tax=Purpureocillium lavendulum TaxID=1247861 RepID=A0AB34G6V8_9HYPO|nr:1-aminocyclopropane-1-carboxylate oxidase [Purpureocillium lavendulum]